MSYQSKSALVSGRQLSVQRLVIPFTVTGNATPASVVLKSDEPSVLFLRSQGVDQITVANGALDSGETATYTVAANDANGIMNFLVKLEEVCVKVMRANVTDRVAGGSQPCKLGDADGISSNGKIMLTMDSTIDFSAANGDLCLDVEYIVAE